MAAGRLPGGDGARRISRGIWNAPVAARTLALTKGTVRMSLSGRAAIVTGGGRGIGRAIALGLAAAGAPLAVALRKDEESARQTVATIEAEGETASAFQASVASYDEASGMVDQILADFGHVAIPLTNA